MRLTSTNGEARGYPWVSLLLGVFLSACGGGGDTAGTSSNLNNIADSTPQLTDFCMLADQGTQLLAYKLTAPGSTATDISANLAYNYNWSCNTTSRLLSGNGVPNHAVTDGQFATRISSQNVSFSAPLAASKQSSTTPVGGPNNAPGYALNSVKFDPATAGTCPDTATTSANCNPAGGTGSWQMVALPGNASPWRFNFGVDTSNAHVQPNGEYHYHGLPTGLIALRNSQPSQTMTLIGWAKDGFPMYTQYGDSSRTQGSGTLDKVISGWTLKTTPGVGRPSTNNFAMGHFEQDWEFTGTVTGGLDRCNGHTGPTPENPSGSYHYHLTETYPFVQRCVHGSIN